MNNHPTKDYVIDLDNIWRWLGFTRKDHAMVVLKKHFEKKTDYIIGIGFPATSGKPPKKDLGGRPRKNVLMNVETFKNFALQF